MSEHATHQDPVPENAPSESFIPGPVLLLGAPGVGKGTQAQILMDAWGIPQISTGDLIRDNIREQTDIGKLFQELVANGKFVPDEVVNRMVAARLQRSDCQRGYLLDGFPRTLPQANWLDAFLASYESAFGKVKDALSLATGFISTSAIRARLPVIAVSIEVRYDELLRRITGRRTGPVSKRIYNVYTNPPASSGVCDVDGEPLVQRPDDTEEVFTERMKQFADLTAPVIEHYRGLGRFEVVDGEKPVETVTASIVAALKRMRLEGA